ncbi:MAG: hypothetical protein GY795_34900 [Desulfobacterales bacterium]|nr:hypothetical protein [Desulfobacterales bacterium]
MNHYSFIAIDILDASVINDLELRMDRQETIVLNSFDELKTLVNLFGSSFSNKPELMIDNENRYWQLSKNIEEFDDEAFDSFYQKWLVLTNRDACSGIRIRQI